MFSSHLFPVASAKDVVLVFVFFSAGEASHLPLSFIS